MIKMSVLYPATEGAEFNHDYYVNTHVPLAVKNWDLPAGSTTIEKGVSGPYVAAVHFTFPDMETLGTVLGGGSTAEVMADVANYTTIQPITQISEIVD